MIITFNEEHNILRCLRSLKDIADDIVIVDAASTDDTRSLAVAEGARVIQRAWTNYSDQKNFANGMALHEWILSMDADEELSAPLKEAILAEKRYGLKGAYRFPRLTNYCGTWIRHGGWYPDAKIRLFHCDEAVWEGEHIHEELVLEPGTRVKDINADILHYSYHTVADHKERIQRYSTLHAQRMHAQGRKAGLVKCYLSPVVKFIQGYLLQLGFLDGVAGLQIAWYSAMAVHLKYWKLARIGSGENRPR